MYHLSRPLFLYCETPLHAGSGSELGVVDLPIQRERHTGFPKIEGSSLKGAIRERAEQVVINKGRKRDDPDLYLTFGPEGDGDLHAGALGFTDARLLLFPVKSMKGVFAWVTCPQVLKRFVQDLSTSGIIPDIEESNIASPKLGEAFITSNSGLVLANNRIILEEYTFESKSNDHLGQLTNWLMTALFPDNSWWQQKIGSSLVVLNDEDFRDFVNLSTEVITRTKIDNETGTVADGALFNEEYLPAESILYSLVLAAPVFPVNKKPEAGQQDERHKLSGKKTHEASDAKAVIDFFADIIHNEAKDRLQVGANATIGKGLIRTTFIN